MIQKIALSLCLSLCVGISFVHAAPQAEAFSKNALNPHGSSPKGTWALASTFERDHHSLVAAFLETYSDITLSPYTGDAFKVQDITESQSPLDLLYLDAYTNAEYHLASARFAKNLVPVYLLHGQELELSDAIVFALGDSNGLYALPYGVQVINMFFTEGENPPVDSWDAFFTLAGKRHDAGEKTLHIDGKASLIGLWESLLLGELGQRRYTAILNGFAMPSEAELHAVNELFIRILLYTELSEQGQAVELPAFYSVNPAVNFRMGKLERFERTTIPGSNTTALLRMLLMLVPQASKTDATNAEWIRYINQAEQLDRRMELFAAAEENYFVPQKDTSITLENAALAYDILQYNTAEHALSVLHASKAFSPDALADLLAAALDSESTNAAEFTQKIIDFFAW